jgi:uncharacterized protein YndB with AHSA1/START domain
MAAPPPRATVCVTRSFIASAETVFDAWLDPKIAGRFFFKTPAGEMVRVAIDARVGGAFVMVERRNGEEFAHVGQYREIDRPRRLAFTFAVPKFSNEATRVAIDIPALPQGCTLTLAHDGVLPDYAERTERGWTMILGGLAGALGEV